MNIDGISDYMPQLPFYDLARSAPEWVAVNPSIGDWFNREMDLDLDADGWPNSLPPGYDLLLYLPLTNDLNGDSIWPLGQYRLTWEGVGTVTIDEMDLVSQSGNTMIYERKASHGNGEVRVFVRETDSNDHVRNLHLDSPGYSTATSSVRPEFLADMSEYAMLKYENYDKYLD